MFQRKPSAALAAAGVAFAALGATSLPAPVHGAEGQIIEEIIVTGSRIPRAGFDTMMPAHVIDAEFMDRRAYTNIADALNETTSFGIPGSSTTVGNATNNSDQSSYSAGQSFVNFYGLGSQRTLTLINGRRFVSSSVPSLFTNQAPGVQVDLNMIPGSMVERIESISVGGAPVYGADAVAGTVNVILKNDFEGFEVSTSYGEAMDEGDMEEKSLEILYGGRFADDRGGMVIGIEYNDREGMIQADRDHLNEGWQWRTALEGDFDRVLVRNGTANIVADGGAITPVGPTIVGIPNALVPNFGVGAVDTDGSGNPVYMAFQPDGSLGMYNVGSPTGDTVWSSGGDGIFLPDLTSLYTPITRKMATAFADYDLTDSVELYGELYLARSESTELVNQPAYQSALFGEEALDLTFQADHPLLTQAARDQLADLGLNEFALHRASTDLGDRRNDFQNDLWRYVAGVRGSFEVADRLIDWDFAWIKGESEVTTSNTELINDRFFYALDVVDTADGPQCRVVADPTSRPADPAAPFGTGLRQNTFDNCVPLDIFGEGRASQEAIDYVSAVATSESRLEQEVYSFNATTELFYLPAGGVGFAIGYEHREESGFFATDGVTSLGLGRNVPVDSTEGAYETDEYYAEAYVPIVSPEMEIPGVYALSAEGAYRSVDNNFAGRDDVYTYGGRWAPVPDLEFRGNVTRSVRAPGITELFLPLSGTNSFAADPCDQTNVDSGPNPATRRANCVADGIDPDAFTSNVRNASVQGLSGGNVDLNNEIADAFTYGVVLRPRWVEDLTIAIDYLDFEIEDSIELFTLTQIMESCYDAGSFPNSFCDQFTRLPNGQLPSTDAFQSGYVNAGLRTLRGIAVELDWMTDLKSWPGLRNLDNPGSLAVTSNMFFPREDETLILGAIDDNLNLPFQAKEQIQMNFTYFWNNLTVLWQTRYIGDTVVETDISDTRYPDDTLDDMFLHNMGVSYQFNENWKASLNINNVFDEEPERSAIARGYDIHYDNIGRFLRAGVQITL